MKRLPEKRLTVVADTVPRELGSRCCGPEVRPRVRGDAVERLAGDFALLGNTVRLQLLDVMLRNQGEVCVCDLESAVPVKQPTVSHHLKLLREAGLIEGDRRGLWVYYRVRREALAALRSRIGGVLELFAAGTR